MAEILKSSTETSINPEKINNQEIPNEQLLQSYEEYDLFKSVLNNREDKEKIINILNKIDTDDLEEYLEESCEGYNLIDNQAIDDFIDEFGETENIIEETKKYNNIENKEKNLELIKAEKDQIEAEKDQIEAEKDQIEAETKNEKEEKRKEGLGIIKTNLSLIKKVDNSFFNEISGKLNENNTVEEDRKISDEIYNYLSKGNNAEIFLSNLKEKSSEEEYNNIYNALSNISPKIKVLFDNTPIKLEGSMNLSSTSSIKKHIVLFENPNNVTQKGSIISSGDKSIDTSKNPPLGYITLKNGLKLKTKITAPHTMKLRAEFSKKQKEYEQKVGKLDENIKELNSDVKNLKNDISEKKSRIEQIQNSDISNEDKKRFIDNIKEIIFKNQKLIETKISIINENKSAIELENGKFKIVKERFEEAMQNKIENAKGTLLEGDEKVRKSLKFLDSIGIDSTLIGPLESMIKQINRNSGLRSKLGFDRRINLSNNDLGIRNDGGEKSDGENTSLVKAKFASIINILLTGDKGHPININALKVGNRTFENKEGETLDKDIAIGDIKRNMGINIYGHMFKNAIEYDSSKEK